MTKLDYLKLCFSLRLYQKKIWLWSVFSFVVDSEANDKILDKIPYTVRRKNGLVYFYEPDGNKPIIIEDAPQGDYPLFAKHEKFTINSEWYPGIEGLS